MSFRSQHVIAGLFASVSVATISATALPAHATLPTTRLMSASAISPDQAWQYYNSQPSLNSRTTSSAAIPGTAPEIKALARALGAEQLAAGPGQISQAAYAQTVFDYVRNNISTEFRFGLGKGARGALIDQSGTPFDQAELVVSLLREAGVTATYKVGSMQVGAQDLGRWTGVVSGFSPAGANGVQAVTVNAKAVCRFLADGAIPLQMNVGGSAVTDCYALNGDLAASDSVTIGHIVVEAAGLILDPSFKRLSFKSGINLTTVPGCGTGCGAQAVTALIRNTSAPAETGTYQGQTYYKKLNETALNANLTAQATALETYIATNMPEAELGDIIGERKIDLSFGPTALASSPRQFSTTYSWGGQIPDVFRFKLSVPRGDKTYVMFGDETSGQRLWVMLGTLKADVGILTPKELYSGCGGWDTCDTTIIVDAPYAANSGGYGDDTILLANKLYTNNKDDVQNARTYNLTIQYGSVGSHSANHYTNLQRAKPAGLFLFSDWLDPTPSESCVAGCAATLPGLAADILHAQNRAGSFVDTLAGSATTRHYVIGSLMPVRGSASNTNINLHTALSSQAVNANEEQRANSFEVSTMLASLFESGPIQYAEDAWSPSSPAGLTSLLNRNGRMFIDAPNSVANNIANALKYNPNAKGWIQKRVTEGYDFILPGNTDSGDIAINNGKVFTVVAGYYGYRGPAVGDSGAIALLVAGSMKGGGSSLGGEPTASAMRTLQSGNGDRGQVKIGDIDAANSSLRISATDLAGGAGEFPYSLPFQRFYSTDNPAYEAQVSTNSWAYEGPDASLWLRMPNGWTHNYAYSASFTTSLDGALGRNGALAATPLITGLAALFDLRTTPNFDRRLTALFVSNWLNDQINANAVAVASPTGSEVFVKAPSGAYVPPMGSGSSVKITGSRIGPISVDQGVVYNYENMGIEYTQRGGDVMKFGPQTYYTNSGKLIYLRQFRPLTWDFPNGVKITFGYDSNIYNDTKKYFLNSVSNNLGQRLGFDSKGETIDAAGTIWRIESVSDAADNRVKYDVSNCMNSKKMLCDTLKVTLPSESSAPRVITYSYAADSVSPNPASSSRPSYRLRKIYAPSSATAPQAVIQYDDLYRVKSLTDRAGNVARVYSSGVTGGEEWNRAVIVSPRQDVFAATTSIFDWRNNPVRVTSPLGYTAINTYDAAGRVSRAQTPEGDAVVTTYDVRSNVISTCHIGKPTDPQVAPRGCDTSVDPKTTATFKEGPKVRICIYPASCNKPASETDARGAKTTYSWYDTTGLLEWVKSPPDAQGGEAMTSLDYYDFSGTGGTTFKMLKSKSQMIATGRNRDTQYEYDTANKFVLKSMTVDPTGVAAKTCFKFDGSGRLIETTGPRGGVC